MLPKTISDYGAPYQDSRPCKDPTTQAAAARYNRMAEDVAQGSRTVSRAVVSFVTTSTGATVTVDAANVTHFSVWGSGSAQKPTVVKTATGTYTVTWEEEFDDALVGVDNMDAVAETEAVVFTMPVGRPNVRGATNGDARVSEIASNVVTILVYDTATPPALSDLGGTATIDFAVR